MNTRYLFIVLVLGIFFVACNKKKSKDIVETRDTISALSPSLPVELSFQKLQGIWTENDEDNAIFFIKDSFLYYVENQNNPISIRFNNDTLYIEGEVPVLCKVIKLNEDSLCYIDNITNEVTRLKRKE